MRKHHKITKLVGVMLSVTLLFGIAGTGMVATAADYTKQEALDRIAEWGNFQQGDTVTVDGIKYEVIENEWWVNTMPPGDKWRVVDKAYALSIKDVSGNEVSSVINVGVEEGNVFLTSSDAVSWSITNNTAGAALNDNYSDGVLVSFNQVGSVTLVAANGAQSREVVINTNNSTVQLNASTIQGAVESSSPISLEKGQALELYVDCTDPEKLVVNNSNSDVLNVTRGTTGVPLTLYGHEVGTSQVDVELYGKTMTFPVTVNTASTANFTVNGSPVVGLTTIQKDATITVNCSLNVDSWAITGGNTSAVTITKNGSGAVNIKGNTLGVLTTITAYDASNKAMGTFDVYVTNSANGYFTNILDYSTLSEVQTVELNVGETASFVADCTIVYNATKVTWELVDASASGVATLSTSGVDGNNNAIAGITAAAAGTVVLKATANGVSDTIIINVKQTQAKQEFAMKLDDINAFVNGSKQPTAGYNNDGSGTTYYAQLQMVNGRTLLPIRYVAETLGLTVGYDSAENAATVSNGSATIIVPLGSSEMIKVEGSSRTEIDAGAQSVLIRNVTHVPVRALLESLGLTVNWHGDGYVLVTDYVTAEDQVTDLFNRAKAVLA